ncbi:MAG: hypothetical protein SCH70_14400, partial [Candidatus Methanoperedens sp.]|nr:hypothetical protein [Candidatus Methanoperedens sp.]
MTVVVVVLIAFRSYFVDLNTAGTFIWLLVALVVTILHGAVSSGIGGCGKMEISATAGFLERIGMYKHIPLSCARILRPKVDILERIGMYKHIPLSCARILRPKVDIL